MKYAVSGTFTVDPDCDADAFFEALQPTAEEERALLRRIQEMSRLSGMEVIYDLTMFDEEWSPAYRHHSDEPVAWISGITGERREGALRPA